MRKRVFMWYLAFYLVFLAMLIALYIPFYRINLKELAGKSLQISQTMLDTGVARFERELAQLRALSTTIVSDSTIMTMGHISLPPTGKDAYKAYSARKSFAQIASTLPDGMTACFTLPNQAVFAGSRLFYSWNEMYALINDHQFKSSEQWFSYMNGFSGSCRLLPEHMFTVVERSYPALLYTVRVPLNSTSTRQTLFVIISSEHLRELLSMSEIYEGTVLRLTDPEGTILYQTGAREEKQDYQRLTAVLNSGYAIDVELLVPSSAFTSQLQSFHRVYALFIVCYIGLGACFAVFLSYFSSRPMLSILNKISTYLPDDGQNKSKSQRQNAYQYLESYILRAQDRFQENANMLENQEKQLQDYAFQNLVRVYSSEAVENARRYLPRFPADYRLLNICLDFDANLEPERLSSLQVVALSIANKELKCYRAQFMENHLLVITQAQQEKEALNQALIRARNAMDELISVPCRIAVSNPTHGLENLPIAYRQTRQLLRGSVNSIMYYEELLGASGESNVYKILQSNTQFYNCLSYADAAGARRMLEQATAEARKAGAVSESFSAFLFFTFLSSLIRVRDEMPQVGLGQRPLPEFDQAVSVETLMQPIGEYAVWAADMIQAHRESESNAIAGRILAFIEEHISDAELCAQLAAAQLNMTENEIKRIMLRSENKTFFDYVDSLRMERVRDALIHTSLPINKIMAENGYRSLNTLYKAFKRTYGVSPSQMREQHGGEASTPKPKE